MTRFEIDFLAEYTDDAIISELRRVAEHLPVGQSLTKSAYRSYSPRVGLTTIRRRFGDWRQALDKAGLSHLYGGQAVSKKMREQHGKQFSNAELIAELKRVHALVSKEWLTTGDFDTHSVTSRHVLRLRFGSFRKALEAAGIPHHPFTAREFTDEQCFENIATVWTHYGRAPAYREMFKPPSTIQGKTYVIRWGTWRKTLKAFVDWANTEGEATNTGESTDLVAPPITQKKIVPQRVRTEADCREVRPGLRFKVFLRDRFRCVACGRSPATHLNIELHADHILAVANGGKTTLENLQTLCDACNLGKGRTVIS